MGRMLKALAGLSGVYAYRLVDGMLTPVCVPVSRDAAGVVQAHLATIATDRSNRTVAGTILDDVDVKAPEYLTYLAVSRAARKAGTAVVLGRPVDVSPTSKFGVQLAKLTPVPLAGIILADWRVDGHDAKKAGFTLKQLNAAVRRYYAQ